MRIRTQNQFEKFRAKVIERLRTHCRLTDHAETTEDLVAWLLETTKLEPIACYDLLERMSDNGGRSDIIDKRDIGFSGRRVGYRLNTEKHRP